MALSVIVIPGDGVTTQFAIPFSLGYLSENDVTCRVGNEVDGTGAPVYRSLTFLSEETVIVSGPPAGVNVPVRFERTVPRDVLLVDYEDDAVINEDNMNTSQLQLIMLVQEIADGRFDQFQTNVDMAGNRFTSMGDPINAQDGATKAYVDASYGSNAVNLALTVAARDAAIDARLQADASAGVSATQAGLAASSASAALVSEVNALDYRNTAQTHRDNAFKWASEQENVQVDDGVRTGFSAYHWAQKAAQSIGGVSSWAGLTGTISKLQASTALTDVFLSLDGSVQMTGKLGLIQSIAGSAALNIPHGATPTSPQNGDLWTTTSGLVVRVNGTASTLWGTHNMAAVSQVEAEAGTSTTARAWTAQRVAQAIVAGTTSLATDVNTLKTTNAGIKKGAAMTPSGTSAVYSGIPSGVSRVVMHFRGVAFSSAVVPIIRLGTSAGPVTTGYIGAQGNIASSVGYAVTRLDPTGLVMTAAGNVISILHGSITFTRMPGTNTWIFYGQFFGDGNYLYAQTYMGSITLPGELDRIQYTSSAATATLSGTNSMYAEWEF